MPVKWLIVSWGEKQNNHCNPEWRRRVFDPCFGLLVLPFLPPQYDQHLPSALCLHTLTHASLGHHPHGTAGTYDVLTTSYLSVLLGFLNCGSPQLTLHKEMLTYSSVLCITSELELRDHSDFSSLGPWAASLSFSFWPRTLGFLIHHFLICPKSDHHSSLPEKFSPAPLFCCTLAYPSALLLLFSHWVFFLTFNVLPYILPFLTAFLCVCFLYTSISSVRVGIISFSITIPSAKVLYPAQNRFNIVWKEWSD